MDPNYLKYLTSMGIDPSQYIEMQANYLRLLANCYSSNENQRPSSASSAASNNSNNFYSNTGNSQNKPKKKQDEPERIENPFQEEPVPIRKPVNLHDEMPIKSLTLPFEKLLEQEMKKTGGNEDLSSSGSKHSFLKRKSQKIIPKKETTPNVSSPKSQFSAFLHGDSENPSKPEHNHRPQFPESSKTLKSHFKESSEPSSLTQNEKPINPSKPRTSLKNLEIDSNDYEDKTKDTKISNSLSRKSLNSKSPIEPISSDSPKPRQEFLKRGEGKLCVQKRSASLARLDNKRSKLKESQKVVEDSREESYEHEDEEIVPEIKNKSYLKYKKLAKELEEKKHKLEKDALEFYKMRENEVKNLESWKSEEMKKIGEERKKIEKNSKAQDVFELDNLKREIKQLRTTLTKNEEKYNKTIESLKEIIETLTTRNQELQKILLDKTFDSVEVEKPGKSASEVSVKMKATRTSTRQTKEETPKFKKSDSSKLPPTFTFKLPEHHSEDKSSTPSMPQSDSPPIVEIKLDSLKSEKIQEIIEENKTQKIFEDGKREISFSNGVKKEIFPDGFMIVHFNNKDRKETFPDGKIVYHFFENQTVQTTFPDGLQLYQFSNGQTEKHFSDGTVEIKFPDGTIKCIFTDGDEESIFPDGTVQKVDKLGVKVIEFVNGMKDTIMPDGSKIRVYPDGKVKKTAADGKVIE